MATEALATGVTAAQSADIVVAAGAAQSVFLKDAAGTDVTEGALVYIEIKDSAGQYFQVGFMTRQANAKLLHGPATYRLNRPAGVSIGAELG